MSKPVFYAAPQFLLRRSNSHDFLTGLIAGKMQLDALPGLFDQEYVIVLNRSMKMYLEQQIAEHNGVCAQISFMQPWDFIWSVLRLVYPQAGTVNHYDRDYMTWSLLGLITQMPDSEKNQPPFKSLTAYLNSGDRNLGRAYDLCSRIADLFDQYQMYRPDWIQSWNSFKDGDNTAEQKWITDTAKDRGSAQARLKDNLWQIRLWRKLRGNFDVQQFTDAQTAALVCGDRAYLTDRLIRRLADPKIEIPHLPKRIFVFGISSLPPLTLEFLKAFAHRAEVYYILLDPSPDTMWWQDLLKQDDLSGAAAGAQIVNPLLGGCGKQGAEHLRLLFDKELGNADYAKSFAHSTGTDGELDCLLHAVQQDICKNAWSTADSLEKPKYQMQPGDRSVQIRKCDTRLRELEVLRDALLWLFKDSEGTLLPKDVVVMAPDIGVYAPFIDAVFGRRGDDDPEFIPYVVCDQADRLANPVYAAVLQLLQLSSRRVTASGLLQLLSVQAIRDKFGFSAGDIDLIAHWCEANHMSWALDDTEASEYLPEGTEYPVPWSFLNGVERMLMGYMLGPDTEEPVYEAIEGDDALVLGKFHAFVRALIRLREKFIPKLELSAGDDEHSWIGELENSVFSVFFDTSHDDQQRDSLAAVRQMVLDMNRVIGSLQHQPVITLPVFTAYLKGKLSASGGFQPFMRGQLNFCSMQPMRAIPFDYIYIMGLNENEFPRQNHSQGFNLLQIPELRCLGDRSRSGDDRYLFLEALLTARHGIYLSYLSRSQTDKSDLYPSLVLTEFEDYLQGMAEAADGSGALIDCLCRQETMTAYDRRNYRPQQSLNLNMKESCQRGHGPSFDVFSCPVRTGAAATTKERKNQPVLADCKDWKVELPKSLHVDAAELSRYLAKPVKYFLQRQGIFLDDYDTQISDDESLILKDYDTEVLLSDFLVDATGELDFGEMLENGSVARQLERKIRMGALPYAAFGNDIKNQITEDLKWWSEEKAKVFADNVKSEFFQYEKTFYYDPDQHEIAADGTPEAEKLRCSTAAVRIIYGGQERTARIFTECFGKKNAGYPPSVRNTLALFLYAMNLRCGGMTAETPQLLVTRSQVSGWLDAQAISAAEGDRLLADLLRIYVSAQLRPVPFEDKFLNQVREKVTKARGLTQKMKDFAEKLREICASTADWSTEICAAAEDFDGWSKENKYVFGAELPGPQQQFFGAYPVLSELLKTIIRLETYFHY